MMARGAAEFCQALDTTRRLLPRSISVVRSAAGDPGADLVDRVLRQGRPSEGHLRPGDVGGPFDLVNQVAVVGVVRLDTHQPRLLEAGDPDDVAEGVSGSQILATRQAPTRWLAAVVTAGAQR